MVICFRSFPTFVFSSRAYYIHPPVIDVTDDAIELRAGAWAQPVSQIYIHGPTYLICPLHAQWFIACDDAFTIECSK
jgi:hypothetical protein